MAGIEDIYEGVINDVINGVREAFLDENVDVDVLQQLRSVSIKYHCSYGIFYWRDGIFTLCFVNHETCC